MIFTRRFGALAARPDFPDYVETVQEQPVEEPVAELRPTDASAA